MSKLCFTAQLFTKVKETTKSGRERERIPGLVLLMTEIGKREANSFEAFDNVDIIYKY